MLSTFLTHAVGRPLSPALASLESFVKPTGPLQIPEAPSLPDTQKYGWRRLVANMTFSALDAASPAPWPGTAGGSIHARRLCRVPHSSRLSALRPLRISLLILLLAFAEVSRALDPVRNFCRRWGHQTAVIDRRLYIDGGFLNYNPLSQYPTNYTSEWSSPKACRIPLWLHHEY